MKKIYLAPGIEVHNVQINPCMQQASTLGISGSADTSYKSGDNTGNNDAKMFSTFDDDSEE